MQKSKLFTCFILLSSWAVAQTQDTQNQGQQNQITALEQKVQNLEQHNEVFNGQLKELKTQIVSLASENESLKSALQKKKAHIDSLAKVVANNSANIQTTADELGLRIKSTDDSVSQTSDSLKAKTILGIFAFILALFASVVVWLQYKRGQKTSEDKIASLKHQADELNEKIVGQFSGEMNELQKIGEALKNTSNSSNSEPDHSLVKTLADRITFMEMTLYRMDSTVKGHKHLSKSIAQMKDNLLANGYEIVDMLGKEYDEGMRINASFIEDENIEHGKQIISAITKPQINYKGEMIQKAQVTVSQNI